MEVNKVLSKDMQVPPLKPGETVTFMRTGYIKPANGRKIPNMRGTLRLGATETIYDVGDGNRPKMIGNVTKYKLVRDAEGNEVERPVLDTILFPSTGKITVTDREQAKYAYLMRHPNNSSNPFATGKALFEVINQRKDAQKEVVDEEVVLEARMIVKNTKSKEDTIALAKKLGVAVVNQYGDERPLADIKTNLTNIAKNKPFDFIKKAGSDVLKAVLQIKELEKLNYIAYDAGTKLFKWNTAEYEFKTLYELAEGEEDDPYMAFANYLATKGGTHYKQMVAKLKRLNAMFGQN